MECKEKNNIEMKDTFIREVFDIYMTFITSSTRERKKKPGMFKRENGEMNIQSQDSEVKNKTCGKEMIGIVNYNSNNRKNKG